MSELHDLLHHVKHSKDGSPAPSALFQTMLPRPRIALLLIYILKNLQSHVWVTLSRDRDIGINRIGYIRKLLVDYDEIFVQILGYRIYFLEDKNHSNVDRISKTSDWILTKFSLQIAYIPG